MAWTKKRPGRNIGPKLLAVGIAVLLWGLVRSQPKVETVLEARINYVNVPPELEFNPDQADQVTIVVRGSRGRVEELRRRGAAVQIDFAGVDQASEQTFDVTGASLDLPDGLHLVRAVPSQLRLSLEKQGRREVPVQPIFVGAAADSRAVSSFHVEPPRLTVVGPERRVALLTQVTTDPIAITGLVGTHTVSTTAYLPDPYLRFDGDASVTVEVHMSE